MWRLRWDDLGPAARVWRRWAAVVGVGVLGFALVQGVDYGVNGLDRRAKIAQAQEDYALPLFKASTPLEKKHVDLQRRARGITLQHFLQVDRWGEKIFRTAFGVYGYLTVSGSFASYDLVRWTGLGLLLLLAVSIALRGDTAQRILLAITLGAMAAVIFVVLYEAWTVNFQGQGRYFLPLIPMLAVLVRRCFMLPPAALFQWGVLAMALLAAHSFIAVGFPGLVSRYGL